MSGALCAALTIVAVSVGLEQTSSAATASEASPSPAPTAAFSLAADAAVATVNGHDIPLREVAVFLSKDRSETIAYFTDRHDASDSPTFWTTRFAGETPASHLVSVAFVDAERAQLQLDEAAKYSLLPVGDYSSFVASWRAENARRQQAVAAGQPIYGPQQYSEGGYLEYTLGNFAFDLPPLLAADGTIPLNDDLLRSYFNADPQAFRAADAQAAADFDDAATKEQVRLDYLGSQYTRVIDTLVAGAAFSLTDDGRLLADSACVGQGTCLAQ
ncbi:hypothetical protein [Subtercola endophyticus]|uniref:hypothetical protein n=1 Tax=Subtercola endophyticus TaxID=2895559 RepID=UPI001E4F2E4B|nr:hypothetical protein [Subtercola endophyticus]UFS59942.1 hypothetical protein LQ955_03925 [Subtercola endophyticus]